MTDNIKLPLTSADITEALLAQLRDAAPHIFAEGKVDFTKLQAALGAHIDTNPERYGLTWAGKRDAFRNVQVPSVATLRPQPAESVNWDSSENLIIEGDNLEVLKLLQKPYHAKVKMIYIDPPYNTGNEFIYPDNFRKGLDEYLRYTGQLGEDGTATSTNKDTSGRYHSNWLNMMYPRLFLARNLLREDGVIFISIGESELSNLTCLCNEIFGEENFIGIACRVAKKSNNKGDYWSPNFDYLVTVGRNKDTAVPFFGGVNIAAYDQVDEEGSRKGEKYQLVRLYMSTIQNRNPEQRFFIECPDGSKVIPPGKTFPPERPLLGDGIWRWSRKKFDEERDKIVVKKARSSNLVNENGGETLWNVYTKTYLNDVIANASAKPNNLIEDHINQIGSHEMGALGIPFDYPKPSTLIKFLIEIARVEKEDVVLDFFAGSGTTAHAVLDINQQDGGRRKFILVQLPEKTDHPQYPTIAHITRERVRRVIARLDRQAVETSPQLSLTPSPLPEGEGRKPDRGFRAFKLDSSNFKIWRSDNAPQSAEQLTEQLKLYADNVLAERNDQDRLYELILKSGIPLSARVENVSVDGRTAFSVSDGNLLICLEPHLDRDTLRALFACKPQMVLCLDVAFDGNDALKTNTVLEAQTHGIVFKTV